MSAHTDQNAATDSDPVCGMTVDAATSLTTDHEGITYHFCSQHWRDRFLGDPHRLLDPAQ